MANGLNGRNRVLFNHRILYQVNPYPIVIQEDKINLFAQDPYYHARRFNYPWRIIPSFPPMTVTRISEGLYCFLVESL